MLSRPAPQAWILLLGLVGLAWAWWMAVEWDRKASDGTNQVEELARASKNYRKLDWTKPFVAVRRLGAIKLTQAERIRRRK